MNIEQVQKLNSAQVVTGVMKSSAHQPLWLGVPGIVEAVGTVESVTARILERSLVQSAKSGQAEAKTTARDTMVDAAFLVTSGLIALSSATRNPQLFAQVNLTRTLIGRGRETDVVNRCRSLFDLGTAHAVLLAAKYHTNAADLKALDDAITAFGALKAQAARESGVQRGGDPGIGGFVRGPGRGAGEPA